MAEHRGRSILHRIVKHAWGAWVLVVAFSSAGCYYDLEDDDSTSPQVTATPAVDNDRDGYPASVDCDDYDPDVSPGAAERCNGKDDDCDGVVDNGFALNIYYWDVDGDGFGGAVAGEWCSAFDPDTVLDGGDCDDDVSSVYPGADEVCNGIDDNCDGQADEGLATQDYYPDADGDGWGQGDPHPQCGDYDPEYAPKSGDCDDANATVNPGAVEVCNNIDDDCDGEVDDADALTYQTFYVDDDGDGYGVADDTLDTCFATLDGYSAEPGDCDDADPAVHPGADDTCDGVDTDCDGVVDSDPEYRFYPDQDGDGYGGDAGVIAACTAPDNTVDVGGDCNDDDPDVSPAAEEDPDNGVDDDCDGLVDKVVSIYVTENGSSPVAGDAVPVVTRIQDAIDMATSGQIIGVGPGTYPEHIDFRGKDIQLLSLEGPDVTIIDGQMRESDSGKDSVVLFIDGETNAARISGFTITGGTGTVGSICGYSLGIGTRYGGGICTRNASPTIEGNIIEGNEVWGSGGGMYLDLGNPTVRDNIVRNNTAGYDAAGINLSDVGGEVVGNVIVKNLAGRDGAGLYAYQSSPLIANNIVAFNISHDWSGDVALLGDGAGITLYDSYPTVTNNVIAYNEAQDATGGGIWIANTLTGGELFNNTIVGNEAKETGGGVVVFTGEIGFENNIVAFNSAPNAANLIAYTTGSLVGLDAGYNLYYLSTGSGGVAGITTTDTELVADPTFVDDPTDGNPLDDDYRLASGSPAIDAGNPDVDSDPDGSRVDMGAFGGPRGDDFTYQTMTQLEPLLD